MAFIDGTALDVTAPALQRDLGIDATQLLWIINGYMLTLSALILVGGSLGDIFGRKRVFMIGIALFTLASVLCGFAQSPGLLIGMRVVQGIGGALMTPGSLALLSASVPGAARGGDWHMVNFRQHFDHAVGSHPRRLFCRSLGLWRLVFFINVPLALIALAALAFRVPESYGNRSKRLDIPARCWRHWDSPR